MRKEDIIDNLRAGEIFAFCPCCKGENFKVITNDTENEEEQLIELECEDCDGKISININIEYEEGDYSYSFKIICDEAIDTEYIPDLVSYSDQDRWEEIAQQDNEDTEDWDNEDWVEYKEDVTITKVQEYFDKEAEELSNDYNCDIEVDIHNDLSLTVHVDNIENRNSLTNLIKDGEGSANILQHSVFYYYLDDRNIDYLNKNFKGIKVNRDGSIREI